MLNLTAWKHYIFVGLCGWILSASSFAEAASGPFDSPTGFSLKSNSMTDNSGQPVLYGGTSSKANWIVAQWGAPGNAGPFSISQTNANEWDAASGYDAIHVFLTSSAPMENIAQDGKYAPCTANNAPDELDLLFSPNTQIGSMYSSGVRAKYGDTSAFPTIDMLTAFQSSGTYTFNGFRAAQNSVACTVVQGAPSINLILVDTQVEPQQIFWYNIHLSFACVPAANEFPGSSYYYCSKQISNPTTTWFWDGKTNGSSTTLNFGLNDVMTSYGYSPIEDTANHDLSFDLLSGLKTAIAAGASLPNPMDSNLSHWKLSGYQFGQAIWGGIYLSTTWQGFVPTWTVAK